jgi:hypothetical protein
MRWFRRRPPEGSQPGVICEWEPALFSDTAPQSPEIEAYNAVIDSGADAVEILRAAVTLARARGSFLVRLTVDNAEEILRRLDAGKS